MLNNRGVSILRIILIIILVVVLYLLARPSYLFLSKYIDRINARTNIQKLEALASDYAQDHIDNYRKCTGSVDSSCLISVDTLREENYIYSEKILKNPLKGGTYNGNLLVCYNNYDFNSKYMETYSDELYCNENFSDDNTDNSKNIYSNKLLMDVIKNESENIVNVNGELRYVSVNAKNYILFNGSKYRILGLTYDADGNYKIKITRPRPVLFSEYSQVSSSYVDSKANYSLNSGDFYSNISSEYKNFISPSNWGYSTCSDVNSCISNSSSLKWYGSVGILSLRDVIYTTNCQNSSVECLKTSYLDFNNEALINYIDNFVYVVDTNSGVTKSAYSSSLFARPTIYLRSDLVIIDGTGEKYYPFRIGLGG